MVAGSKADLEGGGGQPDLGGESGGQRRQGV